MRPRKGTIAPAQYDASAGAWIIPVSDSWLDLLSGEWSIPVQLRAEQLGDDWAIRVRPFDKVFDAEG